MTAPPLFRMQTGRLFWTELETGHDLIGAITGLVQGLGLTAAAFDVSGQVGLATVGAYDAVQQVWVTEKQESGADMVYCQGNVVTADGQALVSGRILLADKTGRVYGGRLFSDTIVQVAEVQLIELQGQVPARTYDPLSALWRLSALR